MVKAAADGLELTDGKNYISFSQRFNNKIIGF